MVIFEKTRVKYCKVFINFERKLAIMMTKETGNNSSGRIKLENLLDKTHGLYQLANKLNWDYLAEHFGQFYSEDNGRPGIPIRIMTGLHYLKYLENESDESVVERFRENPYWQYFCGLEYFAHEIPCHPTTLVKWRKRLGIKGVEKLLTETLNAAKRLSFLTEALLKRVNVDTTVQEKAITFPTDAKLCHKMREHLVKEARLRKISLRQTYVRVSKRALTQQSRYVHAQQMKRARKETKKVKNYLGRVVRDIERKIKCPDIQLNEKLLMANRLLIQQKDDKNKLYSLHAPEVECIAKGKIHKKYEFGCKVSVVTTAKEPWVVGIKAHHGNPYDGHTLKASLKQAKKLSGVKPRQAFVDKGYRGKEHHPKDIEVFVTGRKGLSGTLKRFLKARCGIEPIIGHLKEDNKLCRNHLLGKIGDHINALLSGCAFNLRKIIRYLLVNDDMNMAGQLWA
jgi:IS5 family transposase